MYFNGGTLQILLGAFGNWSGGLGPSTKNVYQEPRASVNWAIIGSDYGLSPGQRQAIVWTNAGILFIGPLGTKFSEILIAIRIFSFTKMHLKILSGKKQPFCHGL